MLTVEAKKIIEQIQEMNRQIRYLQKLLQGQGIDTVHIQNLAVTDAKIASLAVEKLLAGELTVAVDVGDPATGFVRIDGGNNRILVNDGTNNRIVIGEI